MTRMLTTALAAVGTFGPALLFAAPAAAQEADVPVNQVIVYGDQECPPSTADQITVCVRQEDPYRIPQNLRQSESKQNEAWAERVAANRNVGATGAGSCNTVGAEGQTGCSLAEIDQAYAEKRNSSDVQMGKLVAEARAERLSEIDETARLDQQRVEAIEAEYEARRKAQEAAAGDADATPLPDPAQ
ncbi:hypothetical protein [Croceicoccus bisphenolivorans]|uniref:hypothetical protein n=1 Tax=Croceicoccus bisphenolivorans TaxID=1783232 RepID=UPI00083541AB|nr:hypothetical protein [Croceicoccus bisphenolivorans]